MKRNSYRMTVSAGALLLSGLCATSAMAESHGLATDYKFETGKFMKHTAYHDSTHMSTNMSDDGAYSKVNKDYDQSHGGKWYIEEQREGWHAIAAGITDQDTSAIDRGFKILNWGWDQQDRGGGFDCGGIGRSFHSTAFFVEASAHACLLLENSPYASQYQKMVDTMKPKLLAAAHWMVDHEDEGKKYNKPYTHRRYMVADALGETGVLCDDADLVEQSKEFVHDGLRMQDPSGYNPEKGGFDVSYNAGGLFFAEEYYTMVANGALRDQLYKMLEKGVAWEASKVRSDGSVDTSGSTRVDGANAEISPNGAKKKLAVGEVYETFAYWAAISGDKSYEDLADKVAHGPRDRD